MSVSKFRTLASHPSATAVLAAGKRARIDEPTTVGRYCVYQRLDH